MPSKAAGVPRPTLFQNLRASRPTELADSFPGQFVAAWPGDTEKIANRYDRSVTDGHVDRAVSGIGTSAANPDRNPDQCAKESRGMAMNGGSELPEKCDFLEELAYSDGQGRN